MNGKSGTIRLKKLFLCAFEKVGIHTGKVLCGIVGKRRFKFDVWSNDVTFANKMESSGKPGMVHISEKTYAFLKDQYFVLDGEDVGGKFYNEI